MKSKTIWMSELSLGSGNFIIRTNVGETIGPAMHPRSERKFIHYAGVTSKLFLWIL